MPSFRFLAEIVFPALVLCWAAVLIYSAVVGDSGYRALAALEAELEEKAVEADELKSRREALAQRADLLNSKSLDPDLVDERIRAVLGYSREGDVVIPRGELDTLMRAESSK